MKENAEEHDFTVYIQRKNMYFKKKKKLKENG